MLEVFETTRWLRWTRGGWLVPWLGPALRGLIARRLKAAVCRFSSKEQDTVWRYCNGCPHVAVCPYGRTFQPDPPSTPKVFAGQTEAVRPIVLAPEFPAAERAIVGQSMPLRVLLIRGQAAQIVKEFWDVVRDAGSDPAGGLDPERTTFDVLQK